MGPAVGIEDRGFRIIAKATTTGHEVGRWSTAQTPGDLVCTQVFEHAAALVGQKPTNLQIVLVVTHPDPGHRGLPAVGQLRVERNKTVVVGQPVTKGLETQIANTGKI